LGRREMEIFLELRAWDGGCWFERRSVVRSDGYKIGSCHYVRSQLLSCSAEGRGLITVILCTVLCGPSRSHFFCFGERVGVDCETVDDLGVGTMDDLLET
jgi:hypothetical protein